MDPLHLLFQAAMEGRHEQVEEMIHANPQFINSTDVSRQESALHKACSRGKVAVVRLLLVHGADSAMPNRFGDTPLLLAVQSFTKRVNLVRSLLKQRVVRQMINHVGSEGTTALWECVYKGHPELLKMLVDAGADPIIPCNNRRNPLWYGLSPIRVARKKKMWDCIDTLKVGLCITRHTYIGILDC